MNRGIALLCLGMSAGALANPMQNEYVELSVVVDRTNNSFQLACTPKRAHSEMPKDWVQDCNRLGRQVLDLAVDSGMAIEIPAEPFGEAGRFVTEIPLEAADNIKPERLLSPAYGE
ncbi:hypothetical protein [Ferrimonas balearica]|uniref:hypothetical protein n=1 Tax=Ferrimonas balearica TaxID=44012 RepID=UPI001C98F535|nr:hypothetical protein [Ferrimonas balearica]MBY5992393.1 hypothetical protein [Ferrimonas balearica]